MHFTTVFTALAATLPFATVIKANHDISSMPHRSRRHSYISARSTYTLNETHQGQTFFDNYSFFTGGDPTDGQVNYMSQQDATNAGLAYVQADNTVIMKVDDTTSLSYGQNRNSVRITSNNGYSEGLIIANIYAAAHGCSVWPAYWMVGADWPNQGEVDILEYVNGNTQNQITVHTGSGCTLDTTFSGIASITGIVQNMTGHLLGTECASSDSSNAGCGVQDFVGSAGHGYNMGAGGYHAVLRTSSEIAVWYFPRGTEPKDIDTDSPDPTTWGTPTAYYSFSTCSADHFGAMNIVFDITLCGGWAQGAYSQTCSGDCASAVMDPSNFADAHWAIGSVKIFNPN